VRYVTHFSRRRRLLLNFVDLRAIHRINRLSLDQGKKVLNGVGTELSRFINQEIFELDGNIMLEGANFSDITDYISLRLL
jgi:hypothetical protein